MRKKMKTTVALIAVMAILAGMLSGCGSAAGHNKGYKNTQKPNTAQTDSADTDDSEKLPEAPEKKTANKEDIIQMLQGVWVNVDSLEALGEGAKFHYMQFRGQEITSADYLSDVGWAGEITDAQQVGDEEYSITIYHPEEDLMGEHHDAKTTEMTFELTDSGLVLAGSTDVYVCMGLNFETAAQNAATYYHDELKPGGRLISEDEAYQIAYDFWDFTPGDVDPESGYKLSVALLDTVSGSDGHTYYAFGFRWLVVDHYSMIDMIYINQRTGECLREI